MCEATVGRRGWMRWSCLFGGAMVIVLSGTMCAVTVPAEFLAASVARGGSLYDKWWSVTGATAPTTDHPLWASRPDTTSNTRTGADTWRCKECHGWDYKGVVGAYATGSHKTGIVGIFGTTKTAQEIFDLLKNANGAAAQSTPGHDYGTMLSDADIWDLARFVLEGQIDTDTIIDSGGAFTGAVASGQTLYENPVGTALLACSSCHGTDGLSIPPGAPATHDDWVGKIANDNPWEFQHKLRYGQPSATAMPQLDDSGASTQDINDLGAYAQTLPQS